VNGLPQALINVSKEASSKLGVALKNEIIEPPPDPIMDKKYGFSRDEMGKQKLLGMFRHTATTSTMTMTVVIAVAPSPPLGIMRGDLRADLPLIHILSPPLFMMMHLYCGLCHDRDSQAL